MAEIRFDIMTLFPEMMETILSESIIGRARRAGIVEICCRNIRDYSQDKFRRVDDTPYGGGKGMLMQPEPIYECYSAILHECEENAEKPYVIYLSPKGRVLTQETVKSLAGKKRLVLLCGHYEGVDQRVIDEICDDEISCGDYVLTGGELPAAILVDAVSRLKDGVLAAPECYENESLASGLLEYPQYTRPFSYHGREVPEVLVSGHHEKIEAWRLEKSLELTKDRRPELYEAWLQAHPPVEKKKRKR